MCCNAKCHDAKYGSINVPGSYLKISFKSLYCCKLKYYKFDKSSGG